MSQKIIIKGARVHNLKNISLEIPRNKLVVITGLSGSGKSSLAFDTIYAEGQRRYVESLSAYARQFLGLMDKPDVDLIEGLSPAISIDQKSTSHNPRSTVGTVTEIYDYLRLLYARIGRPHCYQCKRPVSKQTTDEILNQILKIASTFAPKYHFLEILSPIIRDQKGEHKNIIERLARAGFRRLYFDGEMINVNDVSQLKIDKQKKHNLKMIIDQLQLKREGTRLKIEKSRLRDDLEQALDLSNGLIEVGFKKGAQSKRQGKGFLFSQHLACPHCNINLPKLEPRDFSFNSPHGACPKCTGLGTLSVIDPDLVIPNKRLSISEGAIRPWTKTNAYEGWHYRILNAVAKAHHFSLDTAVEQLTKRQLDIVLYGTGRERYDVSNLGTMMKIKAFETDFEGVIPNLERRYKETTSDYIRQEIERYIRIMPCSQCQGRRLKAEVLAVAVGNKSISDLTSFSIKEALRFFEELADQKKRVITDKEYRIAHQILKEIKSRLTFLDNVGLDYLTLDRSAMTLSGGEAQRIRLATQIGSGLTGVLYILDEPSIGLHQRDNRKLLTTLKALRDLGNTVIVVEHDETTIRQADFIIDIGPGAGQDGGEIVALGNPSSIMRNKSSLTGQYLAHKLTIEAPKKYRPGNGKKIIIKEAAQFNLKNIDIEIPLATFTCITGISGSGKSTLMTEILAKGLAHHFYNSKDLPGKHRAILGIEHLDKVITIDQSPIGRTPRSNPATYTGAFTPVRDLFSQLPEAKIRGYRPGRFSFNVVGGRCEACQGEGLVKIEMQFLPDVYIECEECQGTRYNKEALEIHYKGKNIAQVLGMTVEEAQIFFTNIPAIFQKLKTLKEVGLGYIKLGQSATTLSGGEAQRVKLATELSRRATGRTLYILDEPTTGLHFDDVKKLLKILNQLVDKRNTVIIIEHHLDVIKSADWIIDLGPEGGERGGYLVASGTPVDVARVKKSYTGQFLRKILKS